MALHIGDAFIRILVQMEGLVKGMREAESITRQSAAGMQSALDSSTASMQQLEQAAQQTRSAAGWLGASLGALSAVGMATMKGIAGTAMRTQELGIVLDVVSRNAGVAAETTAQMEAEMKGLGMTTQAARTIITRMIQTNVDLSKGTDLVRVAQDMAVISMEDSSTAAQGLMRAIVTMNPILLRKYGIMTGLEDIDRRAGEALGILSYETNKSGKTIKKWTREITGAERQQAIFNMILEEGTKFAGTYTDAMDAPGKAMRSFSRYIMEAQEAIGEYWLPILNKAVGMAGKLVKAFNKASPALKKFVAIALPVGTALSGLAGAALMLYSQWGRILPVIKGVAALLSGLAAPVAAVIAVVAALGAAWHFNWFGIRDITASVVSRLQETFGALAEYFKMVVQEGDYLNDWLTHLPGFIQPAVQGLGQLIATLQEVVGAFISGAPGDYPWEDIFPPWLANIAYEVSHVFEGVRDVILDMRAGVFGVDYPWEDVFPPWLADIAYKAVSAFKKAQEAIQILQQVIDAFVSGAPGDYPWEDIFPPWLADIAYEVSHIFEGIRTVIADMRAGVFGVDYPWEDVFPDWLADITYEAVSAFKKVQEALQVLRQVMGQLVAAFQEGGLTGAVEELGNVIERAFGPEVAAFLAQFVANVVTFGQDIIAAIQNVIFMFQEGGIVAGLQEMVTQGLSLMQSFIETFGDQLALLGQALIDWIGPKIPIVLEVLGELADSMLAWIGEQAPRFLAQLETWGRAFIDWIAPLIPPLLAKLGELAGNVIRWIGEQIPIIAAKALEWGQGFVDWIGPKIPIVINALGGLINNVLVWIVEQIPVLIQKLAEWGTQFIEWITPIVEDILPKLGELLGSILTWIIGTAVPAIIKKAVELASALVDWITDTGPDGAVGQVPGALQTFLETLGDFIINTLIPALIQLGINMVSGLLEGLEQAAETLDLAKWAGDVLANIQTAITGIWEDIKAIGKSIVTGLIAGVKAKAQALIDAVTGAVQAAIDWVKEKLGMGSPSQLFFEFGLDMMRGLANGIEKGGSEAQEALGSAVGTMSEDLAKYFAFVIEEGDYLNDWLTHLPESMRPVVKEIGQLMAEGSDALAKYFAFVIEEGDYLNDWLTHLPESMRPAVEELGRLIATGAEAVGEAFQLPLDELGDTIVEIAKIFDQAQAAWGKFLTKDNIQEIKDFGEALTTVIGALNDVLAMSVALGGWEPLANFRAGIDRLVEDTEYILKAIRTRLLNLWGWSGARADTVWGHLVSWADSVSAVMGVIGDAVEAFTLLREYKGLMPAAIDKFITDIELVLNKLAEIAPLFETRGLDAILKFAVVTGAIMEGIGRAIQPLLDLADFAPDQATMRAGIDNFFAALEYFLDEFAWGMWRWEDLASVETAEIAERMGQIMSGVGEAIQPLLDIAEYAPDQAAFRNAVSLFFANLEYFLDEFAWGMWRFEDLAGQKAVDIAERMGRIMGGLGETIQPLLDIADYSITPGEAERSARLFFQSLEIFLDTFAWEAERFEANVDPALVALAGAIGYIVSGIGKAIGPLMDLAQYGFVETEYMGITYKAWLNLEEVQKSFDMFFQHLGMILAAFEETSKEWEVSDAAKVLAEAIGELASNLSDALTLLTDMAEYGKEASRSAAKGFRNFLRDIRHILFSLELANETMGPALVAAKEFALACADVLSAIQEGINALNSLGELKEMPDLVGAGINIIKSLEDGMVERGLYAAQAAQLIIISVTNAFVIAVDSFGIPSMYVAGQALIDGMIAGITAREGALYNAIQQVIQNATAMGGAVAGAAPTGLGGMGGLGAPMAAPAFATPGVVAGPHYHYELEYHAHREEVGEEDAAKAMKLIEFRNRWR